MPQGNGTSQRVTNDSRSAPASSQPGHGCGHAEVMWVRAAATVAPETTVPTIRDLAKAAPIEFISPQAGACHPRLCNHLGCHDYHTLMTSYVL